MNKMTPTNHPEPDLAYCAAPLAAYACRPEESRGRVHTEPESRHRNAFQRDRDRIIHATAFRRLKDKAQVFTGSEGDHYRTRLTHTLEVAQVARTLSRALYLHEDLAESIALAHDLGHPPFAHRGEDALAALMADYGGFAHNDQTVRVLTKLEERYPEWPGLNLCFETLEGLVKHNGPALQAGEGVDALPYTVRELVAQTDFRLYDHATLEAQVVDLADDIAYHVHDVEDGLRAGFFTLDELAKLTIFADIIPRLRRTYADRPDKVIVFAILREHMGAMIDDVLLASRAEIAGARPQNVDDVRAQSKRLIIFSPAMWTRLHELRAFLFERMYAHPELKKLAAHAARVIGDLFNHFMSHPDDLPADWRTRLQPQDDRSAQARLIADYIAGMTDGYARQECARWTGSSI